MTRALERGLAQFRKNYIVNSGMQVSQENGTAAGTGNGYYPADQFAIVNSSAVTFSAAQVASPTPGGSPNRIRVTATSAVTPASGTYMTIRQRIEGLRVADLLMGSSAAKAICLQFGVKAPQGTYGVTIYNSAADRVFVGQFTISAPEANTDVVKSVTVAGETTGTWLKDIGIGLAVDFVLTSAGTAQVAPAAGWQTSPGGFYTNAQTNFFATNGNVFELFDVGLYEGTSAPAYQLPDFASELALCLRYYCKSFALASPPAQNFGYTGALTAVSASTAAGSAAASVRWPVPMRATPTVVTYNPSQSNANWIDTVANSQRTVSVSEPCDMGARFVVNAATSAAATHLIHWSANARL